MEEVIEMGVHQYFKRLSDMERLIRLPENLNILNTMLQHTPLKVTKIAQYLATVEEYHGRKINWKLI